MFKGMLLEQRNKVYTDHKMWYSNPQNNLRVLVGSSNVTTLKIFKFVVPTQDPLGHDIIKC